MWGLLVFVWVVAVAMYSVNFFMGLGVVRLVFGWGLVARGRGSDACFLVNRFTYTAFYVYR